MSWPVGWSADSPPQAAASPLSPRSPTPLSSPWPAGWGSPGSSSQRAVASPAVAALADALEPSRADAPAPVTNSPETSSSSRSGTPSYALESEEAPDVDYLVRRPSGNLARRSLFCFALQEDGTSSRTPQERAETVLARPSSGRRPAGTLRRGLRGRSHRRCRGALRHSQRGRPRRRQTAARAPARRPGGTSWPTGRSTRQPRRRRERSTECPAGGRSVAATCERTIHVVGPSCPLDPVCDGLREVAAPPRVATAPSGGRGDAAAATWIFRGDGRRRGRDVDSPRPRATPRPRRG